MSSPDNPRIRTQRSAMLTAVTDDDLGIVARRLIAKARRGDMNAIKLFLSYVVGPPPGREETTENPSALSAEQAALRRLGMKRIMWGPRPLHPDEGDDNGAK